MSTTLKTISPVAVGTNTPINNISYSATDWLEVKNDSPFGITVQVIGVSANSFFLTPFEHNGWPIAQLLQTSQLQIKNVSIIIIPSHYYANVATENNSPTNICTINQLSASEAQTNTYPLYTARMNTTVATIANNVNNVGNPPFTSIVYGLPIGDTNTGGALNIENSGFIQLGDTIYQGELSVSGPDGKNTVVTNDSIQTPNLSVGSGGIISAGGLTVTGGGTGLDNGAITTDGSGLLTVVKIIFSNGSITRFKYTHVTGVTTTAAFFNHNLGVVPDAIILVPNDGTLSTGNFNAYYDSATMTTTQVKLQSSSASGIPVGIYAFKF